MFFVFRFLRVKLAPGLGLTILILLLFEIFENSQWIIREYRKKYSQYEGDSIANIVGDLFSSVLGYLAAFQHPRLSILYVILVEIVLYAYKASCLQLTVCTLFPVCA